MVKVIMIGGEPAVGKTSIMREVRRSYPERLNFKYGLLRGEVFDKDLYFIGVFDGDKFEGTDKLSMAVQEDFITFVKNLSTGLVVLEGDRLFNKSVIKELNPCVIIISVDDDVLNERHLVRKDNQTKTFIKSRKTKIHNIKQIIQPIVLTNNNELDFEVCVSKIKQLIDDNR